MDTLHDRTAVAVSFVLDAIGARAYVETFLPVARMLKHTPIPPIGPFAGLAKLSEIARLIPDGEISLDAGKWLQNIPEQRIREFITQSISQLTWVLDGAPGGEERAETKAIPESTAESIETV